MQVLLNEAPDVVAAAWGSALRVPDAVERIEQVCRTRLHPFERATMPDRSECEAGPGYLPRMTDRSATETVEPALQGRDWLRQQGHGHVAVPPRTGAARRGQSAYDPSPAEGMQPRTTMLIGEVYLEAIASGIITQDEIDWLTTHQASFNRDEEAKALKIGRLLDEGVIQIGCRLLGRANGLNRSGSTAG